MKRFIKEKLTFIYKILIGINKNILALSCYYDYIKLRYLFKIKKVGKSVKFDKGFKIFNGARNIIIRNNVYLSDVLFNAGDGVGSIEIEDFVFFSHKVMVIARGHEYNKVMDDRQKSIIEAPILIKSGAWIGSGAIILKGVTIGRNAVVAAGSIVTKNVDDNSIVAGNPAKLIKYIKYL